MKRISRKKVKEDLVRKLKMETPNLWDNIESNLEIQTYKLYSKKGFISKNRLAIIFTISTIIFSFGIIELCYMHSANYTINKISKTNIEEKVKNIPTSTSNQKEAKNIPTSTSSQKEAKNILTPTITQTQIRSAPINFVYYKWQDKYYKIDSNDKINKDKIGKYLGNYYNSKLYEINGIDSNKSIAVLNYLGYFRADFDSSVKIN